MIDMEQLNEQSLPPFAPMAIGASKASVDRSEGLFSSVSAEENKFWVVAVNMGYGHQRTAYPLKRFAARGNIINANDYCGITEKDKNIWDSTRGFYEFISRFKKIPLIGDIAFRIYDKFQEIPSFYPKRDLSKPTIGLDYIYSMIKNGWGKDLILKIGDSAIPLVSTFFIPAFMAEEFGYPGEIFCVICDTDVSRTWADLNPAKSRIKYFAPNSWVVNRLKLYGVKEENIFLTGYPLPLENIGTRQMEVLKNDLAKRILNLDIDGEYRRKYGVLIKRHLGTLPEKSGRPFTIMFSIGGAGAQKEIVVKYLANLAEKIKNGEAKAIVSVGIRKEIRDYFIKKAIQFGLGNFLGAGMEIIFAETIEEYFKIFNQKLREADILWTKPSELSFYSGLGLPIIIAPSIGSQEDFNKKWILRIGAGIVQENPKYASQWMQDYLKSGRFVEAAMAGFLKSEKLGTYNIERICRGY